jgi:N-acetyl-beta-hexosaminidase
MPTSPPVRIQPRPQISQVLIEFYCSHSGHTQSWGKGYPELLTECYDGSGKKTGELGPLNPARNSTYEALWALFQDAATVFPDTYFHLGGDEVPFDCWRVWSSISVCVVSLFPLCAHIKVVWMPLCSGSFSTGHSKDIYMAELGVWFLYRCRLYPVFVSPSSGPV